MNHIFLRTALAMTAVAALGSSTAVWAANPLGAYIGAGVGVSNVGNDNYYNYNYGYNGYNGGYGNEVAWKGMIGIRPIAFVGAELEYIDFGSSNGQNGCYGYGCGYGNYYYSTPSSHPKATVLYGVGYLPLPFLDVYGKLGVARLQTNQSAYYPACQLPTAYACSYQIDQWNDKFAFGVGVQTHIWDFAFRAEYERISSQYGNPAALTVGFTWEF
jgi:hypothetical protein